MSVSATTCQPFVFEGFESFRNLTNVFVGLAVFSGGFVLFEPAPYELILAAILGVGILCGLRIPRGVLPLLTLTAVYSFGGVIASFQMDDYMRGLIYSAVTFFLGLTACFFAITIRQDMGRLRLIFRVYVAAAVATSIPGILGYFDVSGFGLFTRYERAQGVFADPNVFAPFLVAPALYLIYGIMVRSVTLMPARLFCLGIILLGLFLAFSRGAWGMFAAAGFLFYFLILVCERHPVRRIKFILFGVFGIVALSLALITALQFDAVYSIFQQRAELVQDYDGARLGRFARHLIGFELALSTPLGLGPLEFGYIYGEDTHNVYLKGLMGYGWLGFVCWMLLIVWTVISGFKLLFNDRPWRVYFQIAYVVFLCHLVLGWIIDVDHWRHVYLMLGIVWGCIMLEKKWQQQRILSSQRPTYDTPAQLITNGQMA